MVRKVYNYNEKTLQYEEAKPSVGAVVKRLLWLLATALSLAFVIVWVLFNFVGSPKEQILEKENNELRASLENINTRLQTIDIVLEDIQNRDDQVYRAIFEANPIPVEQRNPFLKQQQLMEEYAFGETMSLLQVAEAKTDQLIYQLALQERSLDTIAQLVKDKNALLKAIPAIRPIKMMYRINSGFGYRYHPILKVRRPHYGVDIAAPRGTPIYATADGVVSRKKQYSDYGITVVIDHGYSYSTLYAHMSKKVVKPGQKVRRGELIGYVGNTGISTGNHLHYEVRKNDRPVNPVHYFFHDITPEEYEIILKSSKEVNQALS